MKGKIAVITGTARSIGTTIARSLADNGAEGIVIVDIDMEAAVTTAEEINKKTGCSVTFPVKVM